MSIEITLRQAKELVEFFGGHDCEVTVIDHEKGLLAYCTEYPEEGGQYLGDTDVDDDLAINGETPEETFVADVRRFTEAVGCTIDRFNVRQTALYIGLQLEEMAEKLEAIHVESDIPRLLRRLSDGFKSGVLDKRVANGDREAMLDADVDIAWVTIGSALSQGADLLGALREVARANLDKIGPDGTVLKDENGKVKKPSGWRGPDLAPYVLRETAVPAIVFYPAGSLGEPVESEGGEA